MNVLICLIGGNPLPNYVVAKHLLMEEREDKEDIPIPDKVFFLHSNDTEDYARNIKNQMEHSKENIVLTNLGNKEKVREKKNIQGVIINKLNELSKTGSKISSIHLNFTGGTKPMALYSNLALSEYYTKNNHIQLYVSDLCPEKHRIILDNGYKFPSEDLRKIISLNIKELLELHGMEVKPGGEDKERNEFERYFINSINKIVLKLIERNELEQKLEKLKVNANNFKNEIKLNEKKQRKAFLEKTSKEMKQLALTYDDSILKGFKFLCPEFPYNSIGEMKPDFFLGFLGFINAKWLIKFIKGKWLEEYIQQKVLQIQSECGLNDVVMSLKAYNAKRKCEMDVVTTKGYEMCLFSCVTSKDIGTVKGKAFEAMYRATQLGGDHAKAIIVNIMPCNSVNKDDEHNNKTLKKDLSSFDAKEKVQIIGLEEIRDENKLISKLKQILQG